MMEGSGSGRPTNLTNPTVSDPDPGGPKTFGSYGFGSTTLPDRGKVGYQALMCIPCMVYEGNGSNNP
jgi:hypothetical protein